MTPNIVVSTGIGGVTPPSPLRGEGGESSVAAGNPCIKLYIEQDYEAMSEKAAQIFAETLKANPKGAFGFATGGTPVGMYKRLVQMSQAGLDFSGITTFNLDEYFPIARENDQSYYYFMQENLFGALAKKPASVNIPNGSAKDAAEECAAYEKKLQANEILLQILGIGNNGHIAFNEPCEFFPAVTHHVALDESTIEANARFFATREEVPRHAITMGIGSIMRAKAILMLASGHAKAEILKEALTGPVTPRVPASILQFHPNVVVVCDKEAGALL